MDVLIFLKAKKEKKVKVQKALECFKEVKVSLEE
jgi:hypothetical protein